MDWDSNIFRAHGSTMDRLCSSHDYVGIFALIDSYSQKHYGIHQSTSQCDLHPMHRRCAFRIRYLGETRQNALSSYAGLILTQQKEQRLKRFVKKCELRRKTLQACFFGLSEQSLSHLRNRFSFCRKVDELMSHQA